MSRQHLCCSLDPCDLILIKTMRHDSRWSPYDICGLK